jgi:hypothetical protein
MLIYIFTKGGDFCIILMFFGLSEKKEYFLFKTSGVVRFLGAWGQQSPWPAATKIMNF